MFTCHFYSGKELLASVFCGDGTCFGFVSWERSVCDYERRMYHFSGSMKPLQIQPCYLQSPICTLPMLFTSMWKITLSLDAAVPADRCVIAGLSPSWGSSTHVIIVDRPAHDLATPSSLSFTTPSLLPFIR